MKADYYLDPLEFSKAMITYRAEADLAKLNGEERPQISEYIGACFIKIAENHAMKAIFSNYPYKEDMVGDAIRNCVVYADRFDPSVSTKAFEYFSQICYYSFTTKIKKEKNEEKVRFKIIESVDVDSMIRQIHDEGDNGSQFVNYLKKEADAAKDAADAKPLPKHLRRAPKYHRNRKTAPTEGSSGVDTTLPAE